jgi:hypothetical protein
MLDKRPVYREIFAHGPPGMIWIQAAIRAFFGWRSEVLHSADVIIVALIVSILVHTHWRRRDWNLAVWPALLLFVFYFSTSEWCHCQPDTWMLLPALVCVELHQWRRTSHGGGWLLAVAEGMLWATAILIKPFAVIPCIGLWLVSLVTYSKPQTFNWNRWLRDLAWCFLGGMTVTGLFVAWLIGSGNVLAFLDVALSNWNQEYFATSENWLWRSAHLFTWFWPWSLVHVLAIPVACLTLMQTIRRRTDDSWTASRRAFIAALYLGWFFQATYLQRQFPYQQVPAVLLAITLLSEGPQLVSLPVYILGAVALINHPLLNAAHLRLLPRCWQEGSSADLRDHLTLEKNLAAASWKDLALVGDCLGTKSLRDRELTCYAVSSIHLYGMLDLRPSTRFILLGAAIEMFKGHEEAFTRELLASPERFIVSDLECLDLLADESTAIVPGRPLPMTVYQHYGQSFPFVFPVVFRAGRYLVHEVPRRPPSHDSRARVISDGPSQ